MPICNEMMDKSKTEGLAEGEQIGRKKALAELIFKMLDVLGPISEELRFRLENADEESLMHWAERAAREKNMQEFEEQL